MARKIITHLWIATLVFMMPLIAAAQTASNKIVGRIIATRVMGTATVTDTRDPMRPRKLVDRAELTEGQIINTGEGSRVLLVFSNGATLNLAEKSTLVIDEFLQEPFATPVKASELSDEPTTSTTKLNLLRGELMSNVKHLRQDKGSSFTVQTAVGAAGIRGTTFQVVYQPAGNVAAFALRMIEGKIHLDFGSLSRAVDVDADHQVVLEGIPLDASGRVRSLPANIRPTEIPAALKAALALAQQQLLEAATSVSFPATATAAAPQQAYPAPTASDTTTQGTGGATGDTNPAAAPLSPVPPATPPAPRTTPGDGTL